MSLEPVWDNPAYQANLHKTDHENTTSTMGLSLPYSSQINMQKGNIDKVIMNMTM